TPRWASTTSTSCGCRTARSSSWRGASSPTASIAWPRRSPSERPAARSAAGEPVARLEPLDQIALGRARLEARVVLPAHQRRQRHQDRFGAPVGLEPERGAAIVDEVELDVAPAAQELELPLALAPGVAAPSPHDRQIGLEERVTRVAHEGEVARGIALQLIEEDAAHAARLAAVREVEVFVAPLFVARVVRGVVAIADRLPRAMEVLDVFAHRVVGREIGAAAEPQRAAALEAAEVGVNRRHARALRMEHERDAGGEEGHAVAGQRGREVGAQLTVHRRGVDAALLEHGAVGDHARQAAAAAGTLPRVAAELRHTVFGSDRVADTR